MPLPPYIGRADNVNDQTRYQTVFAKHIGAVAAPSAGMHFSRELLKRLEIKGVDLAEITLHAGLGNFREINVEDLRKHKIDSEEMIMPEETVVKINKALDSEHNVCAVGTTVLRAIETPITTTNRVTAYEGWTSKFIQPPYEVNIPTRMISNLHFPFSLMAVNVSSFAGYELLMESYKVAVKGKYRFGTYGDAMLIL